MAPLSSSSRSSMASNGASQRSAAPSSRGGERMLTSAIAETQERVQTPPRKRVRRTSRVATNSSTSSSNSNRSSTGPLPANAKLIELTTILGSRGEYHMRQLVSKLVDRRKNDGSSILSTVINVILAGAGSKELVRPGDVDASASSQGVSSAAVEDLAQIVVGGYEAVEGDSPLPRLVTLKQKLALSSISKSKSPRQLRICPTVVTSEGGEKSATSRLRHLRNFECFFRTLYSTLAGDGMDGVQLLSRLNSFLLGVPGSQPVDPSLASVAILDVRTVVAVAACAGCAGLIEVIHSQEADVKHMQMTTPLGGRVPSRSAAEQMKQRLEGMMDVLKGMTSILGLERCRDSSEAIRTMVLSNAGFASWLCSLEDEHFSAAVVAKLVPGLADRSTVVRGMILEQIHRTLRVGARTLSLKRPQLVTLAPHVLRRCFDQDTTVRLWAVRCLHAIVGAADTLDDDRSDDDEEEQVLSDEDCQLVSNLVWHPDLALRMEAMNFVDAHVFGDPGVLRGVPARDGGDASSAESATALLMIVEFIIQYGDDQEVPELTYRIAEAIYKLSPSRRCHLCCFTTYTDLLLGGLDSPQQPSQPTTSSAEKSVLLALLSATVRLCGSEYSSKAILEGLNKSLDESWVKLVLDRFRDSTKDLVMVAEVIRALVHKGGDYDVIDESCADAFESLLTETTDETLLSLTADLLSNRYAGEDAPAVVASLRQRCSELVQLPGSRGPLTDDLKRIFALSKHWDVLHDDYSLLANLLELVDRRVTALEATSSLEDAPSPELVSLVLLILTLTSLRRLQDGTAAEEHKLCMADLSMLCLGTVEHDVTEEAAGLRFIAFIIQLFVLDLIGGSEPLRGGRSPTRVDQILGDYVRELLLDASLPGPVKLQQRWGPAFNEAVSQVMTKNNSDASFERRKAAILACSVGLYCSRSDLILCGSVGSWLTRQVVDGSSELASEVMAALKFRRQHLQGSEQWKTHWDMLLKAVWRHAVSKNGAKDALKLSSTLCKGVGVQLQKGGHEELAASIKVRRASILIHSQSSRRIRFLLRRETNDS
ncbi:hypothetical protein FOZ61_001676 [Perkinsus olseni]|uniref:Uncharacterized protein n=1 Tax=Perkinsus olseni TaxID=32597 RepID=A0A7J6LVS9_PEROL|nr:hypothetical protein FOZ61_001676 [Perkinsus olseni]